MTRNSLKIFVVAAGIASLPFGQAMAAAITATWNGSSGTDWSDGANWNFSTPPVTANFPNNDANDTFNVLIDGGGAPNSTSNLNVNATIDSLNVSTGDTLNFNNTRDLTVTGGGNIVNNGAINLNGTTSATILAASGSTTISGNGTITLGDSTQNLITGASGQTLTNAAGHAIQGGGSILSNIGGLNNQGTIIANATTPLTIDPGDASTNGGTLRADGGTLNLSAATWANTGGAIEAINGGIVHLNSSLLTINGGTLSSASSGEIRSSVGGGATLNGVTVSAGTTLRQTNTHDLNIGGGIANDGAWLLDGATSATQINFQGTQTLSGAGEIIMSDSSQNVIRTGSSDVLTVGAGQTIRGAGLFGLNSGGYVLNGALRQEGATALQIDPGTADAGGGANLINNGVIRAEGAGGIALQGGIIDNNATIQANAGSFVELASNALEIRGGNLTSIGTGEFRNTFATGAILDGVTVTAGSTIEQNNAADTRIRNGITFDGAWNIDGLTSSSDINFLGSQTIDASAGNTGIINFGGTNTSRIVTGASDVVTLGSRITVQGAGVVLQGAGGMIQDGDVIQQGAHEMFLDPGSADAGGGANYIINGALRAEGAGGIRLGDGVFDNNSTIEANAGSFIDLGSNALEIHGGNLSGEIRNTFATGAILDGVTVTAGSTIEQNNAADTRIRNGITFDGAWNIDGLTTSTDINFLGSQTIDASAGNTGIINFGGTTASRIITGASDVVTLGSRITVQGGGVVLQGFGGMIQDGDVIQQGANQLLLDPGTANAGGGANYIINGALRAEGAGGIRLGDGVFDNNSTIEALAGSFIDLGSTGLEIRGGNLSGEIRNNFSFGGILDGVTLDSGGTIVQGNVADTRIRNGITLNGTWVVNGLTSSTDITALNSQTIGGAGLIDFSDNTSNRIIAANGVVVTQGSDVTLTGAGSILAGAGGYINQGTINANGSNRLEISAGADGFSQQGTLTASGAGGIDISTGANFTQASGLTDVQTGSHLDVLFGNYTQTGGTTNVNGILTAAGFNSNVELQGGRLEGTGTIDFNGGGSHAVNNTGGTLAAGNSPGILTITDGDYIQATAAAFEYELFGAVAGVGHDLLSIMNGDADLAGTLAVVTDFAFASTLNIGDQFEVVRLDTGSFLGVDFLDQVFENITINLAGLAFDQLFIGNSLYIEVTQADAVNPVNSPAHGLLLLIGTVAVIMMRRRRVAMAA